jgi:hypothetical protein
MERICREEGKTNRTKGRNFRISSISAEMPAYTKIIFANILLIGAGHDRPLFASNLCEKRGQ